MTGAAAPLAQTTSPIPLCTPDFGGNDAAYVLECIETGWVSSAGPFVDRFELQVAEHVGAKAAVATSTPRLFVNPRRSFQLKWARPSPLGARA